MNIFKQEKTVYALLSFNKWINSNVQYQSLCSEKAEAHTAVRPHSPLSVVPGPAVRKIKPSTAAPTRPRSRHRAGTNSSLELPRTSFSEDTLKSSVVKTTDTCPGHPGSILRPYYVCWLRHEEPLPTQTRAHYVEHQCATGTTLDTCVDSFNLCHLAVCMSRMKNGATGSPSGQS